MERLTFDGNFCDIAQCKELPCPYNGSCTQRQVWERLKAYEDTGLTPKEAKRMSNILMDVGIDYNCSWEYVKNWLLDDRLRELAEADKDGRLVVLPFSDADDVEMQRDGITYKSDHWNILLTAFADNYLTLSGRKLGVFSVNEAEKALEAMKDA